MQFQLASKLLYCLTPIFFHIVCKESLGMHFLCFLFHFFALLYFICDIFYIFALDAVSRVGVGKDGVEDWTSSI